MSVRSLTFSNAKISKSKHNKWIKQDDSVYNNLADIVPDKEKEKIADLLNIFYYFIICYSKMCFKKDANWDKEYTVFTHYKNKKKYKMGNTFDYSLANDLNSHAILLTIQKQLYSYRKEYFTAKTQCNINNVNPDICTQYITNTFFNTDKKQQMLDFIHESLYDIVKYITPPVKLISADISAKLDKYQNIKSKTRTNLNPKYNQEMVKSILGYDAYITNTSNMVMVSLRGSDSSNNT